MAESLIAKENVDPQHEVLQQRRHPRRLVSLPEEPACVLAIATAFPAAIIDQSTYHDKLFAMCGISDNDSLKAKFKLMCDSSCIETRHTFVTPDLVLQHPELATYSDTSLTTRLAIANKVVPQIAVEATRNAVHEWGRPLSTITHMVLATTSATSIPGVDLEIARALNLAPTVQRITMYQTGFSGGGAALRVGRLLAESAQHARVLVIAVEANTVMTFRKPTNDTLNRLDDFTSAFFMHAYLGDGAAALILGCDPIPALERPLFELHWSAQLTIPNSKAVLRANVTESGLIWHVQKDALVDLIAKDLQEVTSGGRALIGAPSHSDMFWVVHPGGDMVLEAVERALGLEREQLQPSWDVLRSFGNCSSPTCLFVLDEMRMRSKRVGAGTTGAGCEWGLLLAMGPGFTMEVSLLRSVPL